jgi:adenine deaminase
VAESSSARWTKGRRPSTGTRNAAGIPLLAGTDNIAGFTLHRELETYVQAGIGAPQALQIATRNGAKCTQLSDLLGTVAVGKLADVILIDGDPPENIASIREISMVMKEGVGYYPAEIYEAMEIKPFRPPPKVVTARTSCAACANRIRRPGWASRSLLHW